MENGMGTVDGGYVEEKKGVEEIFSDLKMEESGAGGLVGWKVSEEMDEVFEEAVTDAERRSVDSEDGLTSKDGNIEKASGLDGVEKFEDAIENANEVSNLVEESQLNDDSEVEDASISASAIHGQSISDDVAGGQNDEIVENERVEAKLMDDTDEKITEMDAFDSLQSGVIVKNGKDEVVEVSDNGNGSEEEIVKDADGASNHEKESGVGLENSGDGVSDNVNPDGPFLIASLENGDAFKQESLTDVETRGTNNLEEGTSDSSKEIEANGDVSHLVHRNNNGEGILDNGHKDIESNIQPNKFEELNDSSLSLDSDLKTEDIKEGQPEILDLSSEHVGDGSEEQDASSNILQEDLIVRNATTSNGLDHIAENFKQEDSLCTSMYGRSMVPEAEIEENEEIQDKLVVQEKGKKHQPQYLDPGMLSDTVADDSVKIESKQHELKQNTPANGNKEVKPAVDVPLSTENPSNSTSNPAPTPIFHQKPSADGPLSTRRSTNSPVTAAPTGGPIPASTPIRPAPTPIFHQKPSADGPLSTRRSINSPVTAAPTGSPIPASTPIRPAGLGRNTPLLGPAPQREVQSPANGTIPQIQNQVVEDPVNGEAEENAETREKLQMIRVKFLRLARRLGQTPHNVVVAQVLYRLGLAEQLRGGNGGRVAGFSFDRASAMAEQLEAAGQEPLDFSCTIMVLGKSGVGKSATINSIFDEVKSGTDAFQLGTKKVQEVVGTVQGIKVRVIDTPGLLSSWSDQRKNEKILHSVKRFIKKSPPDIVLYLDRLDLQSRDDMPLLRTITDIFEPSIWFNAIVVLTHAASAPPEGPNGTTTSYDMFVTSRSHFVQQSIRQAAGDMRLMNPVSLVENHSACRMNRAGQRVLPNGQVWKPHLLLLSFASKILFEANTLLNLQDTVPGRLFAARPRGPPLPFILSNLLQSRPQLKLPEEQFGDDDDTVSYDLDESSDEEESSEYDELPPFKRLTNAQLAKLSRAQKRAYYDELEYREKLFMKKQLKEEKRRRKLMKNMTETARDLPSDYNDNVEEDSGSAGTVPVPVQDLNLPSSFDSDSPTHRYRSLDSANHWLVRPVLDPHGWDHDVGYEGINIENLLAIKEKIPLSLSGQISKDKKDANLQMEVASSLKHGEGKSTTLAFDLQTVGKDISYTLRSETRFINYRKNKATAALSATYFGDSLTCGVKIEDKFVFNKRGQLVVAGGAMMGRGDVAYGGSLEATLRDKDYPLGRFLSTLGLSVMDWHGDLALGLNAQSQIPIGRFTNLVGRVNFNNKGSGQVSVRLSSSEQVQIALAALIPIISRLVGYHPPQQSGY